MLTDITPDLMLLKVCVRVTHRLSTLTGHTIKPSGGVTRQMDGENDELFCVSPDAVLIPDVSDTHTHTHTQCDIINHIHN